MDLFPSTVLILPHTGRLIVLDFFFLAYIGIIHWEARVKKTDRSLGWGAVTISSGNGIVRVVRRSLSRHFDSCLNWAGSCSSSLPVYSPCCPRLSILCYDVMGGDQR